MSLTPSDFVGWTVTVHENDDMCPVGVFYCTDLGVDNGLSLLDKRDLGSADWQVSTKFVTRLRQGDFAP